jgi:hypothetical protein
MTMMKPPGRSFAYVQSNGKSRQQLDTMFPTQEREATMASEQKHKIPLCKVCVLNLLMHIPPFPSCVEIITHHLPSREGGTYYASSSGEGS